MSSAASVASLSMAAPPRRALAQRGATSRRRHVHRSTSPHIVRAGGTGPGKTAVSKHDVPPKWSTDTCLRENQRVSLKQGEKLT